MGDCDKLITFEEKRSRLGENKSPFSSIWYYLTLYSTKRQPNVNVRSDWKRVSHLCTYINDFDQNDQIIVRGKMSHLLYWKRRLIIPHSIFSMLDGEKLIRRLYVIFTWTITVFESIMKLKRFRWLDDWIGKNTSPRRQIEYIEIGIFRTKVIYRMKLYDNIENCMADLLKTLLKKILKSKFFSLFFHFFAIL